MTINNPAIIERDPIITRTILPQIKEFLERREVIAIKGPRQAGKTTLMNYLYEECVPKERSAFITFEDRQILEVFESDIDTFKQLYLSNIDYLFIDEFQYADDGGQKLKLLYDTTKVKFIISGSSSLELTDKTGKYMVGRMVSFELLPFSFQEYLSAVDQPLGKVIQSEANKVKNFLHGEEYRLGKIVEVKTPSVLQRLKKHLYNYILYGGYPAIALTSDLNQKEILLNELMEAYITKDIKNFLGLNTDKELIRLAKSLAFRTANLISYNELSVESGLQYKTLKNHMTVLEETYVTETVLPFYTNKRLELVKNPMVYFLDTGLRNMLIGDFSALETRSDRGALLENFVYTQIRRRIKTKRNIKFWRTKSQAEVDFILDLGGEKIVPVEVKFSLGGKLRAGKSFYSFIRKYEPSIAVIVTLDRFEKQVSGKTDIYYIPAYFL